MDRVDDDIGQGGLGGWNREGRVRWIMALAREGREGVL